MQYTKRDWRNRNKIKTPDGTQWLSIPVQVKGKFFQAIKDTQVVDQSWRQNHWRSIAHNYAGADHFNDYADAFEELYTGSHEAYLSRINHAFITLICRFLGIQTRIRWSDEFEIIDGKTERLVSICQQAEADAYLSGPAAKDYIQEDLFAAAGVELSFMDYGGYPAYPQRHGDFEHYVSVIDLLFNVGDNAPRYMKSFAD